MDISLIIPTHQRSGRVMKLLRSLSEQEMGSLEIEVLVVSNLPDKKLEASIQGFTERKFKLRYFVAGQIGVNQARNIGIYHGEAPLVLFLDDDVMMADPSYIQKIFSRAQANPEAAAIGGRYVLAGDGTHSDKAYFTISNSWLSQGQKEDNSAIHLVGGNTLYNKVVLKHHLYFNENITFGGAETELNLKIFQAKLPMYLFDNLSVLHLTNLTPLKLLKKAFRQGLGRAYHEQIVHPEIWKAEEIANVPERQLLPGNSWSLFWQQTLISWFDTVFRIGYLHAKLSGSQKISYLLLLKSALIEIFGLDPKNLISEPDPAGKYKLSPAIVQKLLSKIPFWRIPWFFRHVLGSKLWRIPWFLKWKIFSRYGVIFSKLWLVPWFFKYKFKPWFVSLFSGFWRIPWFMEWVLLIRIRGFKDEHTWKLPWLIKYRIWPIFPWFFSKLWVIPYFLRWEILDRFDIRKLPWWVIPWGFKHYILNHFWRVPWLIKWRILPLLLFLTIFTVNMFFPINTIGLLTFYAGIWAELERVIKKPWADI